MERQYNSFEKFITILIKKERKICISKDVKDIFNQLIYILVEKYVTSCVMLCQYTNKITIDSTAILTVSCIWNVKDYFAPFARNIWDIYISQKNKGIKKQARTGLSLPPVRIQKMFSTFAPLQKTSETAYIFLTAIIEKILIDITQEMIIYCDELKDKKLSAKHLWKALKSKDLLYLNPFLENIFFVGG
jgi:histone H3/H4